VQRHRLPCRSNNSLYVSQAVSELGCSDSNKLIMGSVRLIQLLAQSLRLFVEDKPALRSGGNCAKGGGEDIPSARYAVSALSQLSFLHESDESLLTLMPPDLQLPSLLEAFASSSKTLAMTPACKLAPSPSASRPMPSTTACRRRKRPRRRSGASTSC